MKKCQVNQCIEIVAIQNIITERNTAVYGVLATTNARFQNSFFAKVA